MAATVAATVGGLLVLTRPPAPVRPVRAPIDRLPARRTAAQLASPLAPARVDPGRPLPPEPEWVGRRAALLGGWATVLALGALLATEAFRSPNGPTLAFLALSIVAIAGALVAGMVRRRRPA